jgi:double-strand break repair protein MRE11
MDTFRILIATDNHLGYLESDPIRKDDSFNSFEEILKIAKERQVDFILLGGDLFHDNKPSTKTMHNCMTLLRQYCMGDDPCSLEFLSDQSENFPNKFATVNYQDPNYNVSIPVFSIHGNHDDPSGDGNLCSLDLLSAAGLVNYFGKQFEVDNIAIKPILLRKGESKLALYGLGNVRDERLYRTFERNQVTMFRPTEDTDDWFNMLVLHQNRNAHRVKNYVPEHFLDEFLDLVLWGHEHECLIEPTPTEKEGFFITQPGSSVATSLCEGEAVEEHVGLLEITGKEFTLEKIRLKTVRPFIIDDVVLAEVKDLPRDDRTAVNAFLQSKVTEMIQVAKRRWIEWNPKARQEDIPKPLVRLKVDYSDGFTAFSPHQFARDFADEIANPKDLILFTRRRTAIRKNY